jgi:hypothetical protein
VAERAGEQTQVTFEGDRSPPGLTLPALKKSVILCLVAFMALGAVLRIGRYASNPALWHDEAAVAINVLYRSYGDLTKALLYVHGGVPASVRPHMGRAPSDAPGVADDLPEQGAPVGFLLAEKAAVDVLGNNEYALRLLPLLASLAALPLAYLVARQMLGPPASLLVLFIFAIMEPLIAYAVQVKPYTLDVVVTLLFLWLALRAVRRGLGRMELIALGVLGVVTPWISLGSVMVAAGVGLTLFVWELRCRRTREALALACVGGLWLASFGVLYVRVLRDWIACNDEGGWYVRWGHFMPLPPRSFSDLAWYPRSFFNFFMDPMGFQLKGVAALAFVLGCVALARRRTAVLALLLLPFGLTLLASGLHKYPFSTSGQIETPLAGRVIFFLLPAAALLIGAGAEYLYAPKTDDSSSGGSGTSGAESAKSRHVAGAGVRRTTVVALLAILLLPATFEALRRLASPPDVQEARDVLAAVRKNMQPGDTVYLSWGCMHVAQYYTPHLDFSGVHLVWGTNNHDNWPGYERELSAFAGKQRLWVVVSYIADWKKTEDPEQVLGYMLDKMGKRVQRFHAVNAAAWLYDLSAEPSRTPQAGASTSQRLVP